MGRSRYYIHEGHYPYFITSKVVDGLPLLACPEIAQVVLESLVFIQQEREVVLHAYVLLENHFHLVLQADELGKKLRLAKSFMARSIIESLKTQNRQRLLYQLHWAKRRHKLDKDHQVWQEGFHPKQLTTNEMVNQKIEYENNKVSSPYKYHRFHLGFGVLLHKYVVLIGVKLN